MNIRFYSIVFVCALFATSCTKVEMETPLPDTDVLTPESMTSDLDRIDITANPDSVDLMLEKTGLKISVAAQVDYFTASGEVLFQKTGSIEIKGTGSTSKVMKSIGIDFDTKVDNSDGKVLPLHTIGQNDHLASLGSINLRNSGQDFGKTMVKDLAYSMFALRAGMDIEVKYGKPVHLFLNGAYYGLLNLRTEDSQIGIADLLNVSNEDITIVKMNPWKERLEFKEGNAALVKQLTDAIKNEDENVLRSLIDLDNYMDYLIYQDYIGNIDWPHNNVILYSQSGAPFRFFFFDADLAALRPKNPRLPEMEYGEDAMSILFQILFEDDDVFTQLEERQKYWYDRFSPEDFNQLVDEMTEKIESDIPYLIAKWETPGNLMEWNLHVAQLKRDFERTDHFNRKKYQ